MEIKTCKKCKNILPENRKKIYCTICKNKMDLESYHKNKEKRKQYYKKYREQNPEFVLKSKINIKLWREKNPNYINNWYKEKRLNDINYKLAHNLRERLRSSLKKNSKGEKTMSMLGCSLEEFKIHLKSQFQNGMTWNNYGKKGWHIDHIKPVSSFDLSDPEQQKQCFHYTNLQPLWWHDNLKKYNK